MVLKRGDTRRRGNLKHLIEIQRNGAVTSETGAKKKEWFTVCKVFAEYEDMSGREYMATDAAGFITGQLTVRFLIQYRDNIDQSMRVVFRGVKYQISSIRRVEERRLEILAERLALDAK